MSGLDWLRCPHCARPLARNDQTLGCLTGHSFDIARQGYVNLLGRAAPRNADTSLMLEARARFLGAGHYHPLAEAAAARLSGATRIVEVGAGTGYYLGRALEANPSCEGLATDVSVAAAKRAARSHPRASAIVADTWAGLPLQDGAVDAVLCVFAPRNPAEFARVLMPGGRLVVAVPTPAHLADLRAEYGLLGVAEDKTAAVLASLPGWRLRHLDTLVQPLTLAPEEVADLIAMGPNAFHGHHRVTVAKSTTLAVNVMTLTRPA